ncbi:hypothetical protein VPBG_00117 [Vibrio phage helene 12B3]|uniref:hypothetical protein n=1 Tax=Vibrio phage helene 12B3 TaxID=573173 RepID=UPI0002C088DB|nr:hypothetical protein VPBG_00117 [Vibrio phage helene 12B3]AGG57889.1 hypothetical protein VPBG_00117 [Vibrio phage helene 12B3]
MTTSNLQVIKLKNLEIERINSQLLEAQQNLESAESSRDAVEIDVDSFEEEYKEMLDECYGDFHGFEYSRILEEFDPIAFRCGLNDYCDNKGVEDTQEWIEANEKVEAIESEIEDLESSIGDLESDIEDLENEE